MNRSCLSASKRTPRLAALLLAFAILGLVGCDPTLTNLTAYIGWQGHVQTDLPLSSYFNGDHTIMCWFPAQYPNAHAQPILADDTDGVFFLGLEDFANAQPYNGVKAPTLRLTVNGTTWRFVAGHLDANYWYHLALTRTGDAFRLYLNGNRRDLTTGPGAVDPESSFVYTGSGNLRIGRWKSQAS